MNPKTGTIKKSVVRNAEVPLKMTASRRKVVKNYGNDEEGQQRPWRDHQILPATTTTSRLAKENLFEHDNLKYRIPQLHSTEEISKKMERIRIAKSTKKLDDFGDLTPRSKLLVNREVTKKLNFPPDKAIYKQLIPINVNDSILMSSGAEKNPIRKKYKTKLNKDPIPELSDFLTPIPPLKQVVPLYTDPPLLLKPKNSFYKDAYELHVNFHPDC